MAIVSPGFFGRRRPAPDLPPGQYLTEDFPVLSAGPTPRVPLDRWQFTVATETGERRSWSWADLLAPPDECGTGARRPWSWADLLALPYEDVTVDLHCVTTWSKLGTSWRGVPVAEFLADT